MVAETALRPAELVLPVFIKEGIADPQPISSMPGVMQHTRESLRKAAADAVQAGVGGIIVFGVPADKDALGSAADDPEGISQIAISDIMTEVGDDLVVMADLCLCEYTDHGHCGIVTDAGEVDNDATLDRYASIAVAQAQAAHPGRRHRAAGCSGLWSCSGDTRAGPGPAPGCARGGDPSSADRHACLRSHRQYPDRRPASGRLPALPDAAAEHGPLAAGRDGSRQRVSRRAAPCEAAIGRGRTQRRQAPASGAGVSAVPQLFQVSDSGDVPAVPLLRQRGLRAPGGGPGLLRSRRFEARPGPGFPAGGAP